MNKIILTAEADLKDNELRELVEIMDKKINKINERTKNHTWEIKKLEKEVTRLEKALVEYREKQNEKRKP